MAICRINGIIVNTFPAEGLCLVFLTYRESDTYSYIVLPIYHYLPLCLHFRQQDSFQLLPALPYSSKRLGSVCIPYLT